MKWITSTDIKHWANRENEILEIEGNVRLLSINEIADISHFLFLLKIRKKVWR